MRIEEKTSYKPELDLFLKFIFCKEQRNSKTTCSLTKKVKIERKEREREKKGNTFRNTRSILSDLLYNTRTHMSN
jgi:hypothetical protein